MSASMVSLTKNLAASSLGPTSKRWPREPISLLRRDVYSRLVVFDGKKESHILAFFLILMGGIPTSIRSFWPVGMSTLQKDTSKSESKMAASGSKDNETRVNEPVQLYLAYRRLARAKLEIRIYTRLLKSELGPSLQKHFEEITEQSIPAGGLFGASLEVSPV